VECCAEDRISNNTHEYHIINVYSTAISPSYATRKPGAMKIVRWGQSTGHSLDGLCIFNFFDIGYLIPKQKYLYAINISRRRR
jgi:hypothetical protein